MWLLSSILYIQLAAYIEFPGSWNKANLLYLCNWDFILSNEDNAAMKSESWENMNNGIAYALNSSSLYHFLSTVLQMEYTSMAEILQTRRLSTKQTSSTTRRWCGMAVNPSTNAQIYSFGTNNSSFQCTWIGRTIAQADECLTGFCMEDRSPAGRLKVVKSHVLSRAGRCFYEYPYKNARVDSKVIIKLIGDTNRKELAFGNHG